MIKPMPSPFSAISSMLPAIESPTMRDACAATTMLVVVASRTALTNNSNKEIFVVSSEQKRQHEPPPFAAVVLFVTTYSLELSAVSLGTVSERNLGVPAPRAPAARAPLPSRAPAA